MKKSTIPGIIISLLIGFFVFFIGIEGRADVLPNQVYRVYLNGNFLGLLSSQDELLDIIDDKQYGIRERYNVDQVHPPRGLEIRAARTFSGSLKTAEEIYNMIEETDPFTINGYIITIIYPEEEERGHEEAFSRDPATVYVLSKEDFENAFKTVIGAFVGSEQFELFFNDNQAEIVDVGSIIENIYWTENINIRPGYISVNENILTSAGDISRYLFFGTIEDQESHTVREGDDIESISAAHNLNPDEFLVANPEFRNRHVLLSPGQTVNVGLIAPIVSIVAELHVVEDIINRYETEYVNDPEAWAGTRRVVQEGMPGTMRVTEKIRYVNGEIQSLVIANHQVLTPTVNRVVSRGTRVPTGTFDPGQGNESWSWPTNTPFIITSRFGPRWGRLHTGIDIAGTGYGSPIRAAQSGIVVVNRFESGYGHYVVIDHQNGFFTLYSHLTRPGLFPVGAHVQREQIIGFMGCSGFCTGTHLHFEVRTGSAWNASTFLDPCRSIFSC